MTVESADAVTLTDLEVIQRWSLAVRQASAGRAEIVAALRADLDWLEGREPRSDKVLDVDDVDEAPARPAKRAAPKKAAGRTTRSSTARTATTRTGSTRKASTTRRSST